MTSEERKTLERLVFQFLRDKHVDSVFQYQSAERSDFGEMQGEPIAKFEIGSCFVKNVPVGDYLGFENRFAINEKEGYAVVYYSTVSCLSGDGGAFVISANGDVDTLYCMMG